MNHSQKGLVQPTENSSARIVDILVSTREIFRSFYNNNFKTLHPLDSDQDASLSDPL